MSCCRLSALSPLGAGTSRPTSPPGAEHMGKRIARPASSEVLEFDQGRKQNKQIAGELCISETTVNFHIKNIVDKLQARDRTHAVMMALRRGILQI